jgi:hypothetical protein
MISDLFLSAASLYQMEAVCGQPEGTNILLIWKCCELSVTPEVL